jgi:DNA-binding transcriptional LysR family regulator
MTASTQRDNCRVELRQLEYFLAVAETRSFTRAAERLHVVQSGVSATIKALERELGVKLFVRGPGGAALTAAGEELRPRALVTIDAARAAKAAVTGARETVTVGILTSIDVIDLSAVLVKLYALRPGVSVQLRSAAAGTAGLERQLRDGELDIAFLVFPHEPPPDLRARLVVSVPLVLVVPAGHPLAGAQAVPLSELAGLSFVDCPRGYGNRTVVDNAFCAAGIERTVALEVADIGTLAANVRNGLGVGFLSRSITDEMGDSGLVTVRITDSDLLWRLYVATFAARPPSAAARTLLSLIEEATGD